jgi:hypothetical protein
LIFNKKLNPPVNSLSGKSYYYTGKTAIKKVTGTIIRSYTNQYQETAEEYIAAK